MKKTILAQVLLFAKGAIIGGCMVVPGISAGTIIILCGLYGALLCHISGFYKSKKQFFDALAFAIPLALGGAVGIFLLSRGLEFAIDKFSLPIFALFAGLVLGSIPLVLGITYSKSSKTEPQDSEQKNKSTFRWQHLIPMGLACAFVIVFAFFQAPETGVKTLSFTTGIMLVVAGAITVATMIIPGISGAFVLVLIGYYNTVLNAVSTVNIPVLALFVLGAPVGLFAAAICAGFFLKRYKIISHMVIVGFLIGSVIGIFMFPGTYTSATNLWGIAAAIVLFILGFVSVIMLSKLQKNKKDYLII